MSQKSNFFLQEVLSFIENRQIHEAVKVLKLWSKPTDSFERQSQYGRIANRIISSGIDLPELRIAFLSGSTIDHWIDSLRFWLLLEGFQLKAYQAPFNTWRQEAINPAADVYSFNPQFIWLFLTWRDLCFEEFSVSDEDIDEKISCAISDVGKAVSKLCSNTNATVIVNNSDAPPIRLFGNYEGQYKLSRSSLIQHYNHRLPAALPQECIIFDLFHQSSAFGLNHWYDLRLWHHSKHPFSMDAIGPVAFSAARVLAASQGKAKKCIVLDLDNTLWGGIVGDDGTDGIRVGPDDGAVGEAYAHFQSYLKSLSQRGIALAICSKNEEVLAKEPFERRSEMPLSLDDFAVFVANWCNKAENIRQISKTMNLGLESFVFLDDNPAERELVRQVLPEVAVVDLPVDPSLYIQALDSGCWFETTTFSDEDLMRSRAYKENAQRSSVQASATDLNEYLRNLEMKAKWGPSGKKQLPRLSQLVNKTNQFNLTGVRYTQAQLTELANSSDYWVGWFSLSDRFGGHGIIAVVVLRFEDSKAFIDTWAMSCRVFSRGMEDFTFAKLVEICLEHGCKWLYANYVPSDRNMVVKDLLSRYDCNNNEKDLKSYLIYNLEDELCIPEYFIDDNSK